MLASLGATTVPRAAVVPATSPGVSTGYFWARTCMRGTPASCSCVFCPQRALPWRPPVGKSKAGTLGRQRVWRGQSPAHSHPSPSRPPQWRCKPSGSEGRSPRACPLGLGTAGQDCPVAQATELHQGIQTGAWSPTSNSHAPAPPGATFMWLSHVLPLSIPTKPSTIVAHVRALSTQLLSTQPWYI